MLGALTNAINTESTNNSLTNFDIKSKEPVPEGTIRKTWDAYQDGSFTGTNLGARYGTNILDGEKRGANLIKKYKTPRLPNKRPYYVGRYSSGKVPIGAWGSSISSSGSMLDQIYYGGPNYNDSSFPQRMQDNIATNCAGGSKIEWNQYPSTSSPIRYNKNSSKTTNECFMGADKVTYPDLERYFQGGVHYPSFCQMGDYVVTQDGCKRECKNVTSTNSKDTYCNYAMDRLCGKKKGDPIKKNDFNTLVKSVKDWIREPECKDYCGGPTEEGSELCQKHKREYCTNPDNWPDAKEFCNNYWSKNKKVDEIDKVCGDDLTNALNPTNVFTNEGCGYLCRGDPLDVDHKYCDDKRLQYCTKAPENMESEYCYQFCRLNSELCENYLNNNYCKDKGDKLDEEIPGTKRKYSNYCGCMMGTDFYDKYVEGVFGQFDEAGYNINGASNIKTSPECIYPKCKGGSIMTEAQKQNSKNCGANCIQVMLNNFIDSSIVGDFMSKQSAECTNIEKKVLPEDTTTNDSTKPVQSSSEAEETSEEEGEFVGDLTEPELEPELEMYSYEYANKLVTDVIDNPSEPQNIAIIVGVVIILLIVMIMFMKLLKVI